MSFLTVRQKIASIVLMMLSTVNRYTLPVSRAEIWWDSVLGGHSSDQYYLQFKNAQSPVVKGAIAALQIGAPLCKVYCQFFFPLMFVINLILMATSKEDKALGMCKTALVTEIIILLLMMFLPQLIIAGISAGGTRI